MKVNTWKNRIIKVGDQTTDAKVCMNGKKIKQVAEFYCLGSEMAFEGDLNKDIHRIWIEKANTIPPHFTEKLKEIADSGQMKMKMTINHF